MSHSKKCTECLEVLSLDNFHQGGENSTWRIRSKCKVCYNILRKHANITKEEFELTNDPEVKKGYIKIQDAILKRRYGITYDYREKMLIEQDHKCVLCSTCLVEGICTVDHCHASGKVRGMLCTNCNLFLGHAKDNIETIKKAVDYLEKHK